MGTIDSMKSVLTQSALDALCERFHIPDVVHPELPGHNDRIHNSPVEMDLFAFINHVDPTKVQIGEREVAEGEVSLLQLTRGRVVSLVSVNDQVNVNVQGAGNDDVNEEGSNVAEANQTEQGDHVVDVGGIDVVADDEIQAISLLEGSTLAMEVRVTAAATMPFVTSSVTPTPEREGPANSISGTGLRTQHPAERFVISSDSPHDSNTNDADDEVTSIVRSSMPPPRVLTAAVATTIVAGATFAPVHESGTVQDQPSFFRDSASLRMVKTNIASPSQTTSAEVLKDAPLGFDLSPSISLIIGCPFLTVGLNKSTWIAMLAIQSLGAFVLLFHCF
ncbi:hypothetical protein Tco_0976298 [Tanacetum coccineum]|uniref:Uncharacterized protein n=1 Tax=Tanacetum coccineum TaxID=301880 RepID=A0ABQ5EGZ6_9ASTR